MKKLLALVLVFGCSLAQANPYHGYRHHHHHGGGWGWVAPAVIGGLVVYGATRAATPTPPPPVVYNPPQTLPIPPVGYRYEQLLDANCNCYRWVLVQNGLQ